MAVTSNVPFHLPDGVTEQEAVFLLEALARVKKLGFGRVAFIVSDGRLVDVEFLEKVHHGVVRALST